MQTTSQAPLVTLGLILRRLLATSQSLQAAAIVFSGIFLADRLFTWYVFPAYKDFLEARFSVTWELIDTAFAPVVWVVFTGLVLGSLTVVITFAAQSVPKLIDLYMSHWMSLLYVWWTIGCTIHDLTIKIVAESGIPLVPSFVFNYHVLLPLYLLSIFPFIMVILISTKTSRVIQSLLQGADKTLAKLSKLGPDAKLPENLHGSRQYFLFEALNQLTDLLTYVPYKESKAEVIEGFGWLLARYLDYKPKLPNEFFKVHPRVREDISFRTMQGQLPDLEEAHTFFEQKALVLLGNGYITFLETGQFDLSTLCAEQLNKLGKRALEAGDEPLIEVVTIRFNTHVRFGIKHGQTNNEPRNLYNLVFHYGEFVRHLVEHNAQARVKTCFGHFVFYGLNCFNACTQAPALAFILDVIAVEMNKALILMHQKQWDAEFFQERFKEFLTLDNFQNVDRDFAVNFFSKNVGVRLMHIGLALYFLDIGNEEKARQVAKDTMQDYQLLGHELFNKTMGMIFARLKFAGPAFWEDTDRGNLNMYYTPHPQHIERFQELQQECQSELATPIKVA